MGAVCNLHRCQHHDPPSQFSGYIVELEQVFEATMEEEATTVLQWSKCMASSPCPSFLCPLTWPSRGDRDH